MENLKKALESCRTDKAARETIKKYGYKIIKDNTKELNSFSVWIDETTRIYKPHREKRYILQKWQKIKIQYSGTPTFFSTNSYF